MNKTFVTMLFATALVPVAAFAQTAPTRRSRRPSSKASRSDRHGTATVPAPTGDMATEPLKTTT